MAHYEHIVALLKTKHVPVANKGRLKPTDGCNAVAARLQGKRFGLHEHTCCWRHYSVRPPQGSPQPERCNARFCSYDEVFKQYVYDPEWVEHLVAELTDDGKYQEVCGKSQSPQCPGSPTESGPSGASELGDQGGRVGAGTHHG